MRVRVEGTQEEMVAKGEQAVHAVLDQLALFNAFAADLADSLQMDASVVELPTDPVLREIAVATQEVCAGRAQALKADLAKIFSNVAR